MIRKRQATATALATVSSLMSAASAASTGSLDPSILNVVSSACSCLPGIATPRVETVLITSTSVCTSNQICHSDRLTVSDDHIHGLRLC